MLRSAAGLLLVSVARGGCWPRCRRPPRARLASLAAFEAFAFLAWEKKAPYAFAVYELPPSIVAEGAAIMRKALGTYTECKARNRWPAYGEGVQELSFKRWSYRLTEAPNALDEEVAA